jgi:hypothetical protein
VSLKGAPELRRRLRAIKTVFKPVGRQWTDETTRLAQSRVKVVTGKTRASIRRKNASMTKAAVVASQGARFLEAGTKEHTIKAKRMTTLKFSAGGQPVFAKKVRHPATAAQPFLRRSGHDALDKMDLLRELVELWNRAA